ncbi:MAG TPA: GNAT family N-acetyltransferase [Longimicrobiales bacterium]
MTARTDTAHTAHPLTDSALARRLERTEAVANAALVESRARLEPGVGAAWIDVAGVYAMFDGPQSPITQTFGLGLFDDVGEAELAQIEGFFRERSAPVCHEVSPLIPSGVLDLLNARGYQPIEFSSVLVRPIVTVSPTATTSVSVRRIDVPEIGLWSQVAAAGWSSEGPELASVIEGFGRVIGHAQGAHCFLAYHQGRPIAAAGLVLNRDVALLAGASTIPESRRLGAQRALLDARLHFAAAQGARLAMVVAQPGSGSQRNAERHGFRVVYTRTKWRLRNGGV